MGVHIYFVHGKPQFGPWHSFPSRIYLPPEVHCPLLASYQSYFKHLCLSSGLFAQNSLSTMGTSELLTNPKGAINKS